MRQEERGVGSGDGDKKDKNEVTGRSDRAHCQQQLVVFNCWPSYVSGRTYHVPYDMKADLFFAPMYY